MLPNRRVIVEVEGFDIEVGLDEILPVKPPASPKQATPSKKATATAPGPAPNPAQAQPTPAPESPAPGQQAPAASELAAGLWVAIAFQGEARWSYHLLNHTGYHLLVTLYTGTADVLQARHAAILQPYSAEPLFRAHPTDWEQQAKWLLQLLLYQPNTAHPLPAKELTFKVRSQHFKKQAATHPYSRQAEQLAQIASLPQLERHDSSVSAPAEGQMPEAAAGTSDAPAANAAAEAIQTVVHMPPEVVDLHPNQLKLDSDTYAPFEILERQVAAFQDYLSRAIAHNYERITFIHGMGSGNLRKEIHKQLREHPEVAHFRPDQEGFYGYGATIAKLKS
jgi:hypothetical protein